MVELDALFLDVYKRQVSGFVNGQTLATATTGTLAFNTLATGASNVGNYLITGSGLTANNGNYTFTQAAANATALTISPASLIDVYKRQILLLSVGSHLTMPIPSRDLMPLIPVAVTFN